MVTLDNLIEQALSEDIGDGDITTSSILEKPLEVTAHLVGQENLVVAGLDIFSRVYEMLDPVLNVNKLCEDGDKINRDDIIAEVNGDVSSVLQGERVALNFIQRLSGIATMTREFVSKVEPYSVTILDTRKTTPGWRRLEKYAVRCGGGYNYRAGLGDAVMFKDNHLAELGRYLTPKLKNLVAQARAKEGVKYVVVEIDHVDNQLDRVLKVPGIDIVLLDNRKLQQRI